MKTTSLTRASNPPLLSGAQPMYLQLYQVLRARLDAGAWRNGATMPAIPALMAEFQTSRVTVRQAMQRLEDDGLVRRRRGIGTVVQADPGPGRWVQIPTTFADLLATLESLQPQVLAVSDGVALPAVMLPADERPALKYVRMQRVHLHHGNPYCLVDLALDERLFRRSRKRYLERPVLLVMAQDPALQIASARQDLSIRSADMAEARHLRLEPGDPVAEVRRVVCDEQGVVVYAAVVVYPSRSVHLRMNLMPPQPAASA